MFSNFKIKTILTKHSTLKCYNINLLMMDHYKLVTQVKLGVNTFEKYLNYIYWSIEALQVSNNVIKNNTDIL